MEEVLTAAQRPGIRAEIEDWDPKVIGGGVDAWITLQIGDATVRYAAVLKRGLRPATLGAAIQQIRQTGKKTLLITDYITPQLADALRDHAVAFMDAAGNAFLDDPPVFVWVKGERPMPRTALQPAGRAFQAGGLQVIFLLLCHPDMVDRPYREIAQMAGVAHGTVGWVMAELPQLRFVARVGKTAPARTPAVAAAMGRGICAHSPAQTAPRPLPGGKPRLVENGRPDRL